MRGLLLAVIVVAHAVAASRDDDRVTRLKAEITAIDSVRQSAKTDNEKRALDARQQSLRKELGILEERQAIDTRQRELTEGINASPLDTLREKLRGIVRTADEGAAQLLALSTRRQKASADRDTLGAQLEAARREPKPNAARLAELEEGLFTRNEELRALALEREAVESEIELAREGDRLRGVLKTNEPVAKSTLRSLFENYAQLGDKKKNDNRLVLDATNLEKDLKTYQSNLEFERQKLASFDGEVAFLERQTGLFTVNPQLAIQRSQKKALVERTPFLAAQVETIKRRLAAVRLHQEMIALESASLTAQFETAKEAYFRRLRWPLAAFGTLIALYILLSHLILPMMCRRDNLMLIRRLVRYLHFLVAVGVLAGFLFQDLAMVGTTVGVASAALVISLQDVCTSMFAWFVIMLGGKFRIGDRLEIDGTRGDVLDIELFRTTMLEVNGWLGTDQPTGRVITIPNNHIFKTKVFNFTHGHPFIWNKVDVTITYSTPVATALTLFGRVLEEETRDQFAAAQKAAAAMQKRYGVEDAVYKPKIHSQISEDGVTLSLFYVSHYRESSATRNRINRRLVAELETHPAIQLAYKTMHVIREDAVHGGPAARLGSDLTSPPFAQKVRIEGNI